VAHEVAADLRRRLVERTQAITVGDPTAAANWMGPVINAAAVQRYRQAVEQAACRGPGHCGGQQLDAGSLARGHFVAPTVAGVDHGHRLWRDELFLPLVLMARWPRWTKPSHAPTTATTADGRLLRRRRRDPDIPGPHRSRRHLRQPAARRDYRRLARYQPFGGWKGSGNTGKAIGSFWYLPQYLREQSQTVVD